MSRVSGPGLALVLGSGAGSLDAYAHHLARRLPVRTVTPEGGPTRRFGVTTISRRSARLALDDVRFAARLRGLESPLHLPNQHLGRYAHLLAAPFVVTVHDLIRLFDACSRRPLIHAPNLRDRLYLRADFAGVARAAGIITVSGRTRDDLLRHLRLPEERVHVVPNGVDHDVFRPRPRLQVDFPYLLFVGSEQPRKNLVGLLRALALLVREPRWTELRLVKIGSPGGAEAPFHRRTLRAVEELGLGDRVVFAGRVEDGDLARWYSGAEALVLPSHYEGFGLPALEAMACGCPVVVSNTSALPEVAGDAAIVVDPACPRSIADGVRRALQPATGRELRARGRARAAAFSWDRCARETSAVYERALVAGHG